MTGSEFARGPDYPYIRAWGIHLGSSSWYIDEQVARAREDRAPADAIYEASAPGGGRTHHWQTMRDVTRNDTRDSIVAIMRARGWIQEDAR